MFRIARLFTALLLALAVLTLFSAAEAATVTALRVTCTRTSAAGAVYHHTFRAGRWGDLLDYNTSPEHFETYRADDQQRIRAIMVKATEAQQ